MRDLLKEGRALYYESVALDQAGEKAEAAEKRRFNGLARVSRSR